MFYHNNAENATFYKEKRRISTWHVLIIFKFANYFTFDIMCKYGYNIGSAGTPLFLNRVSFRELMKLGCKGNCCAFHPFKVLRWYGLTISTPFGLYSEP